MQIDFHHAVTYIACRLGGLNHDDASVVAHSAQYVDDATTDGPLTFTTGERYVRVTSAHRTLDVMSNGDHADNRLVWVPFHFLPGNAAPPEGSPKNEAFYWRMMCKPDSDVARAMVHDCIEDQQHPFALHRFGVALHTYVDTWAHQQFVGIVCELNRLKNFKIKPDAAYADTPAYNELANAFTRAKAIIASHLPVGHAGALTCPDMPFLKWSFTRANGDVVQRDNPTDFLTAAEAAFNMARRFVAKDTALADAPLPAADRAVIDQMMRGIIEIDGEPRHAQWISAIKAGAFSFGAADIDYVAQGEGSWKMTALGKDPDLEEDVKFVFKPEFLTSNWKRFHDAVQHHRLFIVHDLLPRYGLCAS